MPRRPPVAKSDGSNRIRWSGAYAFALDRKCERDAMIAAAEYLLLDESEVPGWERNNVERKAALYAERDGKPVRVQSTMLAP